MLMAFYTGRYPHVKVSSQLMDAHIYLMKRWVLDYLADKKYLPILVTLIK